MMAHPRAPAAARATRRGGAGGNQQQRRPLQNGVAARAKGSSPAPPEAAQGAPSLARDVRILPVRLITVSKGNSEGANAMAEEWADKARRYGPLSELQIKPNPKRSQLVAVQVEAEGEKVLKSITPQDFVVVLDERGKELTSEGMARLIAEAGDTGAASLVFCIGGPFGHAPQVKARGNVMIKLSAMVLNHQVARVVLLEQVYRGWTILRGEPYHH